MYDAIGTGSCSVSYSGTCGREFSSPVAKPLVRELTEYSDTGRGGLADGGRGGPTYSETMKLPAEVERLRVKLARAEAVIGVQGKVHCRRRDARPARWSRGAGNGGGDAQLRAFLRPGPDPGVGHALGRRGVSGAGLDHVPPPERTGPGPAFSLG